MTTAGDSWAAETIRRAELAAEHGGAVRYGDLAAALGVIGQPAVSGIDSLYAFTYRDRDAFEAYSAINRAHNPGVAVLGGAELPDGSGRWVGVIRVGR